MPIFKDEADLCRQFMDRANTSGWISYPEIGDWDIVLVRDGVQIGVQAKMVGNLKVLYQAARRRREEPHYRTVLAPKVSEEFRWIARALGIGVYTGHMLDRVTYRILPEGRLQETARALSLPSIVPVSPIAGSPSPRPLTAWREKAIRICIKLRDQGFVTGQDFKNEGVSVTTWIRSQWIQPANYTVINGRRYRVYLPYPSAELPDEGFEAERDLITAQIKADVSRGHVQ